MYGGNSMLSKNKILRTAFVVLCMVSLLLGSGFHTTEIYGSSGYGFVFLGTYAKEMKIGDSFYLAAVTSNGKKPKFSSDNSKVASVNTYGKITAKKAGTAHITAKISNGEASCKVVVKRTTVKLKKSRVSLENGYSVKLTAESSTGHPVTWKSNRRSIAVVDERGWVTAKKPGTATVTATVDGTTASCVITVKQPTVRLSQTRLTLYKWKSNKSSVATVDSQGVVTAVKNGTAVITVTVDGVKKTCTVTVKKPAISFETEEMSIAVGETKKLRVTVSSGNKPTFSSSNTNVVSVDENGIICGRRPGRAYVYAREDGTKERLSVIVK